MLAHLQHYSIVVLSFIAYQAIMAGIGQTPNNIMWWVGGVSFVCAVYLFLDRECKRK